MSADKIDVAGLARESSDHAHKRWHPTSHPAEWHRLRGEHFARLVLEEAAKVCDDKAAEFHRDAQSAADICAEAIRARMP